MLESVKELLKGKGLLAELEDCRNEEEAIKVLKRENLWGIINYPELEELKESYKNGEIEADGTLSLSKLDEVAGGARNRVQRISRKTNRQIGKEAKVVKHVSDSIVELETTEGMEYESENYPGYFEGGEWREQKLSELFEQAETEHMGEPEHNEADKENLIDKAMPKEETPENKNEEKAEEPVAEEPAPVEEAPAEEVKEKNTDNEEMKEETAVEKETHEEPVEQAEEENPDNKGTKNEKDIEKVNEKPHVEDEENLIPNGEDITIEGFDKNELEDAFYDAIDNGNAKSVQGKFEKSEGMKDDEDDEVDEVNEDIFYDEVEKDGVEKALRVMKRLENDNADARSIINGEYRINITTEERALDYQALIEAYVADHPAEVARIQSNETAKLFQDKSKKSEGMKDDEVDEDIFYDKVEKDGVEKALRVMKRLENDNADVRSIINGEYRINITTEERALDYQALIEAYVTRHPAEVARIQSNEAAKLFQDKSEKSEGMKDDKGKNINSFYFLLDKDGVEKALRVMKRLKNDNADVMSIINEEYRINITTEERALDYQALIEAYVADHPAEVAWIQSRNAKPFKDKSKEEYSEEIGNNILKSAVEMMSNGYMLDAQNMRQMYPKLLSNAKIVESISQELPHLKIIQLENILFCLRRIFNLDVSSAMEYEEDYDPENLTEEEHRKFFKVINKAIDAKLKALDKKGAIEHLCIYMADGQIGRIAQVLRLHSTVLTGENFYNFILEKLPTLNFTIAQLRMLAANLHFVKGLNVKKQAELLEEIHTLVEQLENDVCTDESELFEKHIKIDRTSVRDFFDNFTYGWNVPFYDNEGSFLGMTESASRYPRYNKANIAIRYRLDGSSRFDSSYITLSDLMNLGVPNIEMEIMDSDVVYRLYHKNGTMEVEHSVLHCVVCDLAYETTLRYQSIRRRAYSLLQEHASMLNEEDVVNFFTNRLDTFEFSVRELQNLAVNAEPVFDEVGFDLHTTGKIRQEINKLIKERSLGKKREIKVEYAGIGRNLKRIRYSEYGEVLAIENVGYRIDNRMKELAKEREEFMKEIDQCEKVRKYNADEDRQIVIDDNVFFERIINDIAKKVKKTIGKLEKTRIYDMDAGVKMEELELIASSLLYYFQFQLNCKYSSLSREQIKLFKSKFEDIQSRVDKIVNLQPTFELTPIMFDDPIRFDMLYGKCLSPKHEKRYDQLKANLDELFEEVDEILKFRELKYIELLSKLFARGAISVVGCNVKLDAEKLKNKNMGDIKHAILFNEEADEIPELRELKDEEKYIMPIVRRIIHDAKMSQHKEVLKVLIGRKVTDPKRTFEKQILDYIKCAILFAEEEGKPEEADKIPESWNLEDVEKYVMPVARMITIGTDILEDEELSSKLFAKGAIMRARYEMKVNVEDSIKKIFNDISSAILFTEEKEKIEELNQLKMKIRQYSKEYKIMKNEELQDLLMKLNDIGMYVDEIIEKLVEPKGRIEFPPIIISGNDSKEIKNNAIEIYEKKIKTEIAPFFSAFNCLLECLKDRAIEFKGLGSEEAEFLVYFHIVNFWRELDREESSFYETISLPNDELPVDQLKEELEKNLSEICASWVHTEKKLVEEIFPAMLKEPDNHFIWLKSRLPKVERQRVDAIKDPVMQYYELCLKINEIEGFFVNPPISDRRYCELRKGTRKTLEELLLFLNLRLMTQGLAQKIKSAEFKVEHLKESLTKPLERRNASDQNFEIGHLKEFPTKPPKRRIVSVQGLEFEL